MAVGLCLVALLMIVGGGYAAVDGYGIVLSERGWSMVIAGTVVATGGVLLLGAAVIAGRLRRVVQELTRLSERAGRLDEAVPARPSEGSAEFAPARLDPPVGEPPPAREEAPGGMTAAAAAVRAGLWRRGATSPRIVGGGPDDIAEPSTRPGHGTTEPSRDVSGTAAPVAANGGAPKSAAGGDPSVVGTYNSGGNAYVMYSDGSIEADTPTGRYRFRSLEELKEFIANGGEEGLGAARAP